MRRDEKKLISIYLSINLMAWLRLITMAPQAFFQSLSQIIFQTMRRIHVRLLFDLPALEVGFSCFPQTNYLMFNLDVCFFKLSLPY